MAFHQLLQKLQDDYLVKLVDGMLNGLVVECETEDMFYDQSQD